MRWRVEGETRTVKEGGEEGDLLDLFIGSPNLPAILCN